MKKKIILLIFIINCILSYSNEVYKLGDEIILKINNTNISEIKDALKDYQIDEIASNEKQEKNSYIVKFRSFTLGENKIKISNQEINLKIESNIKEDEKDIYMDYKDEKYNELWNIKFPYITILAFLGVIFSCLSLWKSLKKSKKLQPHEKYLNGIENLDESEYLFQISFLLREYIDSQFSSNFLNGFYKKNSVLEDNEIKFIETLDFAKFSRKSNLKKDEIIEKSNKIFKKIFDYKIQELEKILMILSLVSLIIALARPQNLSQSVKIKKDGIDIVVALDLSQSMQATDFKPSRIDKAKILLKEFISKRDNDRISLVIFGGDAYTKVPLTFDHSVIDKILEKLTVNDITSNNRTAIGMGLGVSVNRLKNSTAKSKVIILMTDGENNSGEMSPQVAAGIAKEFGIKVYTIGIGAKEILVPTMYGTKSIANTELDENLLKYIAKVTDGEYFRASSEENFKEIFKKIDSLEKTKIESKEFFNEKELYENFLIAGILLLLVALIFKHIIYIKIP